MTTAVETQAQAILDGIAAAQVKHWNTLMDRHVNDPTLDINIVVVHGNFCKRLDVIAERIKQTDDLVILQYLAVAVDMAEAAEALNLGDMLAVARIIQRSREIRTLE